MSQVEEPVARARAALRECGLDGIIACSPGMVAFLTGHVVPANLAFPSRDVRVGPPALAIVTSQTAVTVGFDTRPAVGDAIAPEGAPSAPCDDPASFTTLARTVAAIAPAHGAFAVELGAIPAAAIAAVTEVLPSLDMRPLGSLLAGAKAAKSDDEVAGIARACRLADLAHDAIRAAIRPGVSELELCAVATRAMQTAAPSLVLSGTEITLGRRSADPGGHPAPTMAALTAGEVVMSDIYPRHPNGWWADTCSTIASGEVDAAVSRAWRRLADALESGRAELKPGAEAGHVFAAVERQAGPQHAHVGHSIGRDHFEEPIVRRGSRERIPPGAVIVLEPAWTDGRHGIRIEWAFRATPDGGVPLNSFALDL